MPTSVKAETYTLVEQQAVKIALGDIESEELKRVSSGRTPLLPQTVFSELRPRLQALLQTTLDLEEQLAIFRSEINSAIQIESISYLNERQKITISQGDTHNSDNYKVSFNLMTQGDIVGTIRFSRDKKFQQLDIKLLEEASTTLIFPIRNALRYQEALKSAMTDSLTQVGNRLALKNGLHKEVEVSHRYQQPLSILMIDIDHFKSVNDQYGHSAGDHILKRVAATLADTCRQADSTYRYGGEEFVIILSNTDLSGAETIAERIRAAVAGLVCIHEKQEIPVTISLGVAGLAEAETYKALLQRADEALYRAKSSGRNQAKVSNPVVKA